MRMRCLFAALVIVSSARCYAAIDTIIPLPKEIWAVDEPLSLDGFRIAAADDERSQIGAAEINQRIVSLGGRALPVSRLDGRLPDGRWICRQLIVEQEGQLLLQPASAIGEQANGIAWPCSGSWTAAERPRWRYTLTGDWLPIAVWAVPRVPTTGR